MNSENQNRGEPSRPKTTPKTYSRPRVIRFSFWLRRFMRKSTSSPTPAPTSSPASIAPAERPPCK